MLLRSTISAVIETQHLARVLQPEVERHLLASLPGFAGKAVVLKGVRRSGKSTLQLQLMQRQAHKLYCNLEDTRYC
jgi:predicted AAA+ superfamily ATPase